MEQRHEDPCVLMELPTIVLDSWASPVHCEQEPCVFIALQYGVQRFLYKSGVSVHNIGRFVLHAHLTQSHLFSQGNTSHLSHVGGFLAGLFPSFIFLPNLTHARWEAILPFLGNARWLGGCVFRLVHCLWHYNSASHSSWERMGGEGEGVCSMSIPCKNWVRRWLNPIALTCACEPSRLRMLLIDSCILSRLCWNVLSLDTLALMSFQKDISSLLVWQCCLRAAVSMLIRYIWRFEWIVRQWKK